MCPTDEPICIPILLRYYLVAVAAPIFGLAILVFAYFSLRPNWAVTILFALMAVIGLLFAAFHFPYIVRSDYFSLQIGPEGILERTPILSVEIKWSDIDFVSLQAVDGASEHVTYRLHTKKILRLFSFGKFDYVHANFYAITSDQLVVLLNAELDRYRRAQVRQSE